MRATGTLEGIRPNGHGGFIISFDIGANTEAVEALEKLKDKALIVDAGKQKEAKTLAANNYCWKLCDLIAEKLGTTKDDVYLLMLKRYGVFADIRTAEANLDAIRGAYKMVEVLQEYQDTDEIIIRCFFGSSGYDRDQMRRLVAGIEDDAKVYGVDLMTPEEMERALEAWQPLKSK